MPPCISICKRDGFRIPSSLFESSYSSDGIWQVPIHALPSKGWYFSDVSCCAIHIGLQMIPRYDSKSVQSIKVVTQFSKYFSQIFLLIKMFSSKVLRLKDPDGIFRYLPDLKYYSKFSFALRYTNIAPETLGRPIFRCYVTLGECKYINIYSRTQILRSNQITKAHALGPGGEQLKWPSPASNDRLVFQSDLLMEDTSYPVASHDGK